MMANLRTIDGSRDALWMATAVDAIKTEPCCGQHRTDIAVIGGGVTGLSAGLHLASAGVSVVVLEAQTLGFGASGRSGGQVNLGLNEGPISLKRRFGDEQARELNALVAGTPDEVFALIRDHQMNCDATQNGAIFAAKNESRLQKLKSLCQEYREDGVACRILDQNELIEQSGAQGFVGGLRFDACGSLHPLSYTRELARAARANGAKIFDRSPVQDLGRQTDGWRVETAEGSVLCDKVLFCTNAYTKDAPFGLEQTMVPVRSLIAATEPLDAQLRSQIMPNNVTFVDKRRQVLYCRYDRDGRLCVGGRGPSRDRFSPADFDAVKRRAASVFPQLSSVQWDFHWGGRVAITPNGLPYLSVLRQGLIAGMGYNGRGIGMGTVMGRVMAEFAMGGDDHKPPFPVTAPDRYPMHGLHPLGVWLRSLWADTMDWIE